MITFFFVPGYESEEDSDIFDTDKVFGIPQELIKKAMPLSQERVQCIFFNGNNWESMDYDKRPKTVNEQYTVVIDYGEIISHDIFTSL